MRADWKSKMVSIIFPVYNAERYIQNCLDSIKKQSYENFEVILINDGSLDHSGEICDQFALKDARFRVIHNQNAGVSKSRNTGLSIAQGEFIAFCDADDLYASDFLEKMVCTIEEERADIVVCNYFAGRKGAYTKQNKKDTNTELVLENFMEQIFLNNEIGGFVWNKMFRKTILTDLRFNENINICEDTLFVLDAAFKAKKIYYLAAPLYYYFIHAGSAVARIDNIIGSGNQSKYTQVYELVLERYPLSRRMRQYVECGIFRLAVHVKCDYQIKYSKQLRNHLFVKNLNIDAKKYMFSYLQCREIGFIKKMITLLNLVFNLRKIKAKGIKICG